MIFPDLLKTSFFMDKIEGKTFAQKFWNSHRTTTDDRRGELITSYDDTLKLLHGVTKSFPKEQIKADIMEETHGKLIKRCNVIKPIIDEMCGHIKVVNGKRIMPYEEVVENLKEYFEGYSSTVKEYSLIHGDPNFSNAMVDHEDNVWLIDPRGYFGSTKHYGDPAYDRAKVLYGMDGYDLFNYRPLFNVDVVGNEICFDDPTTNAIGQTGKKWDMEWFKGDVEGAYLCVIWICLAEYIKNDIHKACAAFYHGLYRATEFFEEKE